VREELAALFTRVLARVPNVPPVPRDERPGEPRRPQGGAADEPRSTQEPDEITIPSGSRLTAGR